jgi:formate-dependent phosphoribosylglycinamide formyltransferase (GAR transformylase)
MENKKNKEGVKMYDKFLMKINIAKAEVIQEIYVTKEHLDSVKKQNPDFVIPKIPMIRTSKIIFVDEDKIKYLDVTLEYTIYLKDKEIRVDVMEPNYWLKCE